MIIIFAKAQFKLFDAFTRFSFFFFKRRIIFDKILFSDLFDRINTNFTHYISKFIYKMRIVLNTPNCIDNFIWLCLIIFVSQLIIFNLKFINDLIKNIF